MAMAIDTKPVTEIEGRAERNRLWVRLWLYVVCLLVFAMVMVGGATRLTDSGLSITEWKLFLGILPPLSHAQWISEFEKYKLIPEYSQVNHGMSLLQFQFIYWWEWSHRFLGRIVGFVFFLPLVWFWATGRIEPHIKPRLLVLLALGGLQGFVGWWMVSSGLTERVDVSQYRLATHLTLACAIFAYSLWVARGLAQPVHAPAAPGLRRLAGFFVLAVLAQIFLGGLVAGLDAGLAFNDWPTMDHAVVPGGLLVLEPVWRNFFENPKTVQFVHRCFAYGVLALALVQWLARAGAAAAFRRGAAVLAVLVLCQAGLGVVTLMLQVPLHWALAHQAGAVIVLWAAVAHWRALTGVYPVRTAAAASPAQAGAAAG